MFKTARVTLRPGHVRLGPPKAEVKSQKGLQMVTAWWLAIADVFKCAARVPHTHTYSASMAYPPHPHILIETLYVHPIILYTVYASHILSHHISTANPFL